MISLHNVTYQSILHNITLDLPDEGTVGLVGPNGSGKTTLMRCLYGALTPSSGTISIDGHKHLRGRALAKKIAVVVQQSGEIPTMTVAECAALGRLPYGDSAQDLIAEVLEEVGLLHKARCPMAQLSGGEQQRVMIARALIQHTKYLLLDEPTNNLDIRYQLELFDIIRHRRGCTTLVLHDLNHALEFCDTVFLLDDGRVLASGSPHDVLVPEVLEPVYHVGIHRTPHHLHFERMTR